MTTATFSLARYLDSVAEVLPEPYGDFLVGEGTIRERLEGLQADISHEIVLARQCCAYDLVDRLYDLLDALDKYLRR